MKITSEVLSGAADSGDNAYFYGDPYGYDRTIKGTIPLGDGLFTIKGAIPDPSMLAVYQLKEALKAQQIMISEEILEKRPSEVKIIEKVLYNQESLPLYDLVQIANYTSDNLYCEAFLKTIAAQIKVPGTYENGIQIIQQWIRSLRISDASLSMYDGSGLSPRNRISTHLFTMFVSKVTQIYGIDKIRDLLPEAGRQGSLLNFLSDSPAKGHAWLKSGSMSGVLSYTGLIYSKKGKWLSFSVIVNGHKISNRKIRLKLEEIVEYIYEMN